MKGPVSNLAYQRIEVRGASYLVGTAGSGPPLLLLHGFPQTHYCWREVIPVLAEQHLVVAADLRGYGGSSAPPGGPHGEAFTKREMAAEMIQVMRALGHDRFVVAGHDRGARVAYRMALDHPGHVAGLAVVNIIPTLDQFERMGGGPSLGYWPWYLLAQPAPFPEKLIAAAREHFLGFVFDSWTARSGAITANAFSEYVHALDDSTIAAMCADYRASFWIDREHDAEDRLRNRRIACPLLVITGAEETQLSDAPAVWQNWALDVSSQLVPGGHFVPEEAAADLSSAFLDFFRVNRGGTTRRARGRSARTGTTTP
jgi:haloacetate dehalogenase